MGIAEIVVALLGIVASLAPGVLAALTGKSSDAEAIEAARVAVLAIPNAPAAAALDEHLARITRGDEPTQQIAAKLHGPRLKMPKR